MLFIVLLTGIIALLFQLLATRLGCVSGIGASLSRGSILAGERGHWCSRW